MYIAERARLFHLRSEATNINRQIRGHRGPGRPKKFPQPVQSVDNVLALKNILAFCQAKEQVAEMIYMPPKSAEFQLPPAGAHVAVCYRVVDLGTQETKFKGEVKTKHLVLIGWELPDEPMQDGRPFTVSKRYTLSSSPKSTLRKDIESWRGKPFDDAEFGSFDLGKLIGAGCMLNIVHDDRGEHTYANVATIMRLPKGTKAPEPKNERFYFSLDDFNQYDFAKMTDRMKEMIAKSPEYRRAIGEEVEEIPAYATSPEFNGAPLDDDIPF